MAKRRPLFPRRLNPERKYLKEFEKYYRRAEAPIFWSVVEEARFKRAMYNAWKAGRQYGSVVPVLVRRTYGKIFTGYQVARRLKRKQDA